MSTKYYIMTRDKKLVEKYFPYEYQFADTPFFGYEVHIGKRSSGRKPLFQEHKYAYNSVEEMLLFIERHDACVVDEYGREFDVEGLKKNWLTGQINRK